MRLFGRIMWLFGAMVIMAVNGCTLRPEVVTGKEPPGLVCSDLQGNPVPLGRLKGKVVVLFFWSGICCGDTVRQLEPFYGRNRGKGLEIVAVNVGEARETVEAYAAANRLSFTVAMDDHGMSSWLYSITGVPTVFILDRSGIIREKILGDVKPAMLVELVSKHLKVIIQEDVGAVIGPGFLTAASALRSPV